MFDAFVNYRTRQPCYDAITPVYIMYMNVGINIYCLYNACNSAIDRISRITASVFASSTEDRDLIPTGSKQIRLNWYLLFQR